MKIFVTSAGKRLHLSCEFVKEAMEQVGNTRIFGGNEKEAFKDVCADNDERPSKEVFHFIQDQVTEKTGMNSDSAVNHIYYG